MLSMNLNNQSTATQRFFWFCAGADIELLEKCRSDWRKFTSIGVFVCVVAFMATISGTFFLTESFQMPIYSAIFGGLVWGGTIFCVDRVMLAFYQKGTGEFKRILPRLILSLLISIVINEPMFVRVLRGEIEAKMFTEVQAAVTQTRAGSYLQTLKNQLENDINELKGREKVLRDAKDAAEQEMEKERGGIKTDNTTGKLGQGVVFEMKKKIFEAAKQKYETEKIALDEQINAKTQELQKVENNIAKEVDSKNAAETKANGFWRRHELMFAMMWEKPIMIIVFLISSLVLLGIETLPLTQKFMSQKGPYDYFFERATELAEEEAKNWLAQERKRLFNKRRNDEAVRGRVDNSIVNGTPINNPKEQKLSDLVHSNIIRRQAAEVSQTDTISLGKPIIIEVVDNPHLSVQMAIPEVFQDEATLQKFDKQIAEIRTEVSRNSKTEMKLSEATNSDGEEVDQHFFPLIAQLNEDRRLILRFEPLIADADEET